MLHIFQHGQCITNDLVRLPTFNVGGKARAARIMFKLRTIQTLLLAHFSIGLDFFLLSDTLLPAGS